MRAWRAVSSSSWTTMFVCLVAVACSSTGGEIEARDSSSTITTTSDATASTEPALRSGPAESAPTTDPSTEGSVYGPTTTTSTTTTTIPAPPVNTRSEIRVDPIFDPILDELIDRTGVPIRLPMSLRDVEDPLNEFGEGLGVATLWTADDDGYVIYLGAPDCNGGNACRGASFIARTADDDAIDESIGIPVPLPNRLKGRFVDATCGANCGDGYVEWYEDSMLYSVGEKLSPGPRMLDWAWSAIDPDLDAPQAPVTCGTNPIVDNGRFAETYEEDGVSWLVVCSPNGLHVEIIDEVGTIRWADLGTETRDIVLDRADGTSRVFFINGIIPVPLIDRETFTRAVIRDLRCADVDGDGSIDVIDAATGRNHSSLFDVADVVDADSLPTCN